MFLQCFKMGKALGLFINEKITKYHIFIAILSIKNYGKT